MRIIGGVLEKLHGDFVVIEFSCQIIACADDPTASRLQPFPRELEPFGWAEAHREKFSRLIRNA